MMYLHRIKNDSVWKSLKILFMGSLLIFLINNYFGFDNALTVGEIPRWQVLIHLHGGSIGWITLSAIGIMLWVVTGDRDVSQAYEKQVRNLVWAAVIIFAGYVIHFGLGFSQGQGLFLYLFAAFSLCAVLTLWYSAFFAFGQFKNTAILTTVHLLISGALLTAAIGATVGFLLGLEHALGNQFLPLPEGDRVAAHAGMMDTYLFLVASAIIEWGTRKEATRWNWAGLAQALLWMIGATAVPIAYFTNTVDKVLPLFMLMLLLGMLIFLARMGWRALVNFSLGAGINSWIWFGTFWLVVYMGLFLYLISIFMSGDLAAMPTWLFPVFAHAGFVGMMTNLIAAVVASRSKDGVSALPWGESASFWLINLGILAFLGGKVAMDIRTGALVMGIGVVLMVFTMFRRLQAS